MVAASSPVTPYEIRAITYNVPSASEPGAVHTVAVTRLGWVCDCRDFHYRGHQRPCKHVRAAREGRAGKPVVRVRPLTRCALCGELREHTIDAAGYACLPDGARICPPWVAIVLACF